MVSVPSDEHKDIRRPSSNCAGLDMTISGIVLRTNIQIMQRHAVIESERVNPNFSSPPNAGERGPTLWRTLTRPMTPGTIQSLRDRVRNWLTGRSLVSCFGHCRLKGRIRDKTTRRAGGEVTRLRHLPVRHMVTLTHLVRDSSRSKCMVARCPRCSLWGATTSKRLVALEFVVRLKDCKAGASCHGRSEKVNMVRTVLMRRRQTL